MSQIKGKNTKPEMIVRSLVHSMGFRFRLHRNDLPGKPDLVFPRLKKIIEVYGCFWHVHECGYGQVQPKTNHDFWFQKRSRTHERDVHNQQALETLGWKVLIVWECEIRDLEFVRKKILDFLNS